MHKDSVPSKPMSFVAQLTKPTSLKLDWRQRHPALGGVTLHCEGLNPETIPEAGLPQAIRDLELALDAAYAAFIADTAGIPCVPSPIPVAEPIEVLPQPEML